jgi:hypothetical protein
LLDVVVVVDDDDDDDDDEAVGDEGNYSQVAGVSYHQLS